MALFDVLCLHLPGDTEKITKYAVRLSVSPEMPTKNLLSTYQKHQLEVFGEGEL
jgi:hypothetical protein